MSYVKGLRCRECHKQYPQKGVHVCEVCFGPLEVEYDYDGDAGEGDARIASKPGRGICGDIADLLPIEGEPQDRAVFRLDAVQAARGIWKKCWG